MKDGLTIFIDGASRGNPGPAAIGVVIEESGKRVQEISKAIGETTNNVAEYTALICALEEAAVLKAQKLKIFTDSELLFQQVTGQFRVKNEKLKPLFEQAQKLAKGFDDVAINHIPREKNRDADELANKAFQENKKSSTKQVKMVASTHFRVGEESPSSKG